MSNVVSLPNANPLIGTWGSLDEDGTSVEYTVTQTPSGLSVSATDTCDGEAGIVSDIEYDGATLEFTVLWSTGRSCRCRMKPGTRNQAQFSFTYTEHEHLQRRAT
jgi:hypothetical protein